MAETAVGAEDDPDAAYWTERWLVDPADGLDAQAPRRPGYRVRDRAEVAIVRTPHLPVSGEVRSQVLARRTAARQRVAAIDGELARTLEQRRCLTDRIERCTLALTGLGYEFDPRRGTYRGLWSRAATDGPAADESGGPGGAGGGVVLSGARLRRCAEEILRALGGPATSAEIERLVELQGYGIAGRPSQTLANALRPSLAGGCVVKVGRGRYRWAGPGLA